MASLFSVMTSEETLSLDHPSVAHCKSKTWQTGFPKPKQGPLSLHLLVYGASRKDKSNLVSSFRACTNLCQRFRKAFCFHSAAQLARCIAGSVCLFCPFACALALQRGRRYWSWLEARYQNRKQTDTVLKTKALSLKCMHSRAPL